MYAKKKTTKEILDRNNTTAMPQGPKPHLKPVQIHTGSLDKKESACQNTPNMLDTKHHAKFIQKQHRLDAYEKNNPKPTWRPHGNALVTPKTPDKPTSPTKMLKTA